MIDSTIETFIELESLNFDNTTWIANFETVPSDQIQVNSEFPSFDSVKKLDCSRNDEICDKNENSNDELSTVNYSSFAMNYDFTNIGAEETAEQTQVNESQNSCKTLNEINVDGNSDKRQMKSQNFTQEKESEGLVDEIKQNSSNADSLLNLILEETSNLDIDFDSLLQNEFQENGMILKQNLQSSENTLINAYEQSCSSNLTSLDCLCSETLSRNSSNSSCCQTTNVDNFTTGDLQNYSDLSSSDWSNEPMYIQNTSKIHLISDHDETSTNLNLHEIFTRTFNDQLTNINNTAEHRDHFGSEFVGSKYNDQKHYSDKTQETENLVYETAPQTLFSSDQLDQFIEDSLLSQQFSNETNDVLHRTQDDTEGFLDWTDVNNSFYDLGGFDYKSSKQDNLYDSFDLPQIDDEINTFFKNENNFNVERDDTIEYNLNEGISSMNRTFSQTGGTCPPNQGEYDNRLAHVRKYQKTQTNMNENEIMTRDFQCTYPNCMKFYAKMSHLKAHLRRHSGERSFRCDWKDCKWRFSRSDELSRHKRSHFGIKPYPCTLCAKKFTRSDHLAKHLKVHERQKYKQMMKSIKKLKAK